MASLICFAAASATTTSPYNSLSPTSDDHLISSIPTQHFSTKADHQRRLSATTSQNLSWSTLKHKYGSLKGFDLHDQQRIIQPKLGKRWRQYQGSHNWEGLLDPLDDSLRSEILRYGHFVEAAYRSFDFDPLSPTYATCRLSRASLLSRSEFARGPAGTAYRVTKNLRATCGIEPPRWTGRMPSWMTVRSSWIGYVAVCQDKAEIARLGRRDVVVALRGTATCLEWLENMRATLVHLPGHAGPSGSGPMVERGFLSLYTSRTTTCPSLQDMIREEIGRVIQSYGHEPLSVTFTGHSLGAALAVLSAYDVTTTFENLPTVTVISFGGPRVGNRSLRRQLDKSGTRVLRIVNSDDPITKVPGFVIDDDDVASRGSENLGGLPQWIQKRVEDTRWVYADVGQELRLSSKESPHLNGRSFATCHDLKTYLQLVQGFAGSTCHARATGESLLSPHLNYS